MFTRISPLNLTKLTKEREQFLDGETLERIQSEKLQTLPRDRMNQKNSMFMLLLPSKVAFSTRKALDKKVFDRKAHDRNPPEVSLLTPILLTLHLLSLKPFPPFPQYESLPFSSPHMSLPQTLHVEKSFSNHPRIKCNLYRGVGFDIFQT